MLSLRSPLAVCGVASLILFAAASRSFASGVLFVDGGACLGGDGLSWDTAFVELQSALDVVADDDTVTAINVAQGIYKPSARTDPDDPRSATFLLPGGVALRGGFAGFGAPDPDERDIDLYETVLTGDLNVGVPSNNCCMAHDTPGCDCGDCAAEVCEFLPDCCEVEWDEECAAVAEFLCEDLCGDGDLAISSYHVVRASGVDETTVLDGFTITGGKANEAGGGAKDRGGGMLLGFASPTVINCNFTGNMASNVAGALWLSNSAPTFIGCDFEDNVVFPGNAGAAIHNVFGSDLTLINCVFQNNILGTSSTGGGAIFIGGNPLNYQPSSLTATGCVFIGNNGSSGGAILNNGFAELSNCLFAGNVALGDGFGDKTGKGGAIANFGVLTISNSTFTANSSIEIGGGIFAGHMTGNTQLDSVIAVDNCILWGNIGAGTTEQQQIGVADPDVLVNYSCVEGLTGDLGGDGNIAAAPLFVDADGDDNTPGTIDDNLRLSPGSPCIDAADNKAVPEEIDTDLDGNPRFVDDPVTEDTGNDPGAPGPIVDMGAYEFQVTNCPWDINGDGVVDHHDLVEVVHNLGLCDDPDNCPWDLNGDGIVNSRDVAAVVSHFGPCL